MNIIKDDFKNRSLNKTHGRTKKEICSYTWISFPFLNLLIEPKL